MYCIENIKFPNKEFKRIHQMNTEYQIILAAENIETAVKSQLFHPHIPSLVGVLNAWQTETKAANPDFSQINNISISETFKKNYGRFHNLGGDQQCQIS